MIDWKSRVILILGVGIACELILLAILTGCSLNTYTAPPTPTWGPTSLKNPQDYCWKIRVDTNLDKRTLAPAQRWYLFTDHKPSIEVTSRGTEIQAINARTDPPGKGNSHYFSGEWTTVLNRGDSAYVLEKQAHCGLGGPP